MEQPKVSWDRGAALREMLGYLNFSQGKPDPRFQRNINEFFRASQDGKPWSALHQELRETLDLVRGGSAVFRDVGQVQAVLSLVFERTMPAYREHHTDLLFHLSDRELFQPFFLVRVFEAVLVEGEPWEQSDRIVSGALQRLNDFIGHRPMAVLERQKCEPYDHERLRPIPLYIRGAGVAVGKYHDMVAEALEILAQTDSGLLDQAHFSLDVLDELALDPRAYDFSHPVNQRPNYQFGEWDPHCLDNQARYRRFVVRQVTLDALLDRSSHGQSHSEPRTLNPEPSSESLLFEAAAVLAGTMLMASGISGSAPETHDSSVTLAILVPKNAQLRDAFYTRLLQDVAGPQGDRLRHEATVHHQPLGSARQHLNQYLARQRAAQLQHTQLARLFAQMGYPEASREQARLIFTASARMLCEMRCRITASNLTLDRGDLEQAVAHAAPLENLLQRGIGCGAIVDPWNILGFQGQFSIFPALENTVPDPRVDQLTELMEQIFTLYARLLAHAAAAGNNRLEDQLTKQLTLAAWWDQFASVEISGIRHVHGQKAVQAAAHVAQALAAWHRAGEAAADVKFWKQHVEGFNSPPAYAQVVHALLEKKDFVAAMALLMSWLSQVEQVPLEQGTHSFHALAVQWLVGVSSRAVGNGLRAVPSPAIPASLNATESVPETRSEPSESQGRDTCPLVKKFFDLLQANAEEYWQVPGLELGVDRSGSDDAEPVHEEDEGETNVFSAAYDGVSYRDSAEDGHEGEMLEGGPAQQDFDLEFAAERIEPRLRFLCTLSTLWTIAAYPSPPAPLHQGVVHTTRPRHPEQTGSAQDREETLRLWSKQLDHNRRGLAKLLDLIQRHAIPKPLGSHDSLVEYDRRRATKEALIHRVIETQVQTTQALWRVRSCLATTSEALALPAWESEAVTFERALVQGDPADIRERLPRLLEGLAQQPLLYRRLDKGGHPRDSVAARCMQQFLRTLVRSLPRAGLLRESYHVLKTARSMEQLHPIGEGITEFDHLFRVALRSVCESLVDAANGWRPEERADEPLLECLGKVTESFLELWLEHSQSLRLSTLDRIGSDEEWQGIREFVERYGHDLLTPKFLTLGNLRAVLDQGVGRYLEYLEENEDPLHPVRLIDELDQRISRKDAARLLDLVIQLFAENYEEYKDYNTTTTQSDYGERYFILFEFLRLKAFYDRTNWNLQPVCLVHEILARQSRTGAAHLWQDALGERTAALAGSLLEKMAELEARHGVRLATVRDRLQERFTKPLALDRIRVLIEPAMDKAQMCGESEEPDALAPLQRELMVFVETSAGSGLGVPQWLLILEREVFRVGTKKERLDEWTRANPRIPQSAVSRVELERQLELWEQPL